MSSKKSRGLRRSTAKELGSDPAGENTQTSGAAASSDARKDSKDSEAATIRAVFSQTRNRNAEEKAAGGTTEKKSLKMMAAGVRSSVKDVKRTQNVLGLLNSFSVEQRLQRRALDLVTDPLEEGNWRAAGDALKELAKELDLVLDPASGNTIGSSMEREAITKLQEGNTELMKLVTAFQLRRAQGNNYMDDIMASLVDDELKSSAYEKLLQDARDFVFSIKGSSEELTKALLPLGWGRVAQCVCGHSMRHWGIEGPDQKEEQSQESVLEASTETAGNSSPERPPSSTDPYKVCNPHFTASDECISNVSKGKVPATSKCLSCATDLSSHFFCWRCEQCVPHVIRWTGAPGRKQICIHATWPQGLEEPAVIMTKPRKHEKCIHQEFILDASAGRLCFKGLPNVAVIRSVESPNQVLEISAEKGSELGSTLRLGAYRAYNSNQVFIIDTQEERIWSALHSDLCLEMSKDKTPTLSLGAYDPEQPRQQFCCDAAGVTDYVVCQKCGSSRPQIWCQPLQDVLNEPVEGWQETMRNLKVKLREVQIEEGLWDNTIDHLKPTDLEYKGDGRVQKMSQQKIAGFFRGHLDDVKNGLKKLPERKVPPPADSSPKQSLTLSLSPKGVPEIPQQEKKELSERVDDQSEKQPQSTSAASTRAPSVLSRFSPTRTPSTILRDAPSVTPQPPSEGTETPSWSPEPGGRLSKMSIAEGDSEFEENLHGSAPKDSNGENLLQSWASGPKNGQESNGQEWTRMDNNGQRVAMDKNVLMRLRMRAGLMLGSKSKEKENPSMWTRGSTKGTMTLNLGNSQVVRKKVLLKSKMPKLALSIEEVAELRGDEAEGALSRAQRVERKYFRRASERTSTGSMHMEALVSCVPSLWQSEEPDVLCQGFSDLFQEQVQNAEPTSSLRKRVPQSWTQTEAAARALAKGARWAHNMVEHQRRKLNSIGSVAHKKLRSLPLSDFWRFNADDSVEPYAESSENMDMESLEAMIATNILQESSVDAPESLNFSVW